MLQGQLCSWQGRDDGIHVQFAYTMNSDILQQCSVLSPPSCGLLVLPPMYVSAGTSQGHTNEVWVPLSFTSRPPRFLLTQDALFL